MALPPPARLVLIRNEDNLGFTGGNNLPSTTLFAGLRQAVTCSF